MSGNEFLESRLANAGRWVSAAVVVVALHAGCAALGLMSAQTDDTDDEGAIAFELSAVAKAVAEPPEYLMIGPRNIESQDSPPSSQKVDAKPEQDDTPPLPESPLAPEPEVAMPIPRPVLEEKPEEKKPEDAVPQESSPSPPSVKTEAAAPPPIEAETGTKTTAPVQGTSTVPAAVRASWYRSIVSRVTRHKKFPDEARIKGHEGTASVEFTIDRSGQVLSMHLLRSTGSSILDAEVLAILKRASPLPRPPDEMPGEVIALVLPMHFNIKR